VKRFAGDLTHHGGSPAAVTELSMDMSPAFICGAQANFAHAQITFDRFHVMKKLSEAIDEVRRAEQQHTPALKKSRYLWLKNRKNLTTKQAQSLAWLTRPSMHLATARAYRWREDFQAFYAQPDLTTAQAYLRRWCYGAKRSRLAPLKNFITMIEAHWNGIIRWHTSRITNGLLEGTNSLIQAAKARACGYRNKQKMITIIYLIAGKLPLPTTHTN
jgi:transposase